MGGVPLFCIKYIYIYICIYYKIISKTSAMRSTNFGSILIFASCVVGTCTTNKKLLYTASSAGVNLVINSS